MSQTIKLTSEEIDKTFFPILEEIDKNTYLKIAINIKECLTNRGDAAGSPGVLLAAPVEVPQNKEFRKFPTKFESVKKMIETMERWGKDREKKFAIFPFYGDDRHVK